MTYNNAPDLFPHSFNDTNESVTNGGYGQLEEGGGFGGDLFWISTVIAFFGVFLNGTIIFIIIWYKNMKTVPNIFILNLAMADGLFVLGLPFISYMSAEKNWRLGLFPCKFLQGLDALSQFTSIFIVTLMAVDRYIAIVHGMRMNRIRVTTNWGAQALLNGAWLLSFLLTTPAWVFAEVESRGPYRICHIVTEPQIEIIWVFTCFILSFCLPLSVIGFCYILIFMDLRKTSRTTTESIGSSGLPMDSMTRKFVKVVFIIVLAFTICWLPFWISLFLVTFGSSGGSVKFFMISLVIIYLHGCTNPVIYMISSDLFRQHLTQLLKSIFPFLWRKVKGGRKSSDEEGSKEECVCHCCLMQTRRLLLDLGCCSSGDCASEDVRRDTLQSLMEQNLEPMQLMILRSPTLVEAEEMAASNETV